MIDFRLYLITDRRLFPDTTALFAAIEDALKAGLRALQLREKDMTIRMLCGMAHRLRELTARYHAKLFINDRVDVALCVNADGVHLGSAGIPTRAVRRLVGDRLHIGVSTHSIDEAVEAEKEGADFITVGPVFETPSKLQYGAPIGIGSLKKIRERVTIPVFGIGGIDRSNVKDVMDSGAFGIAVIRSVLGAPDIHNEVHGFLNDMGAYL